MRELAGRVAFVTGAASGIGAGIAKTLAAAGMKVAIADVREPELRATAATLSALAVPLDVTNRAAWPAAVDRIERELGKIHVLCSNAGVNFVGATQNATEQDWDFCLGVNVGGAINAVRTVVPRMIEHGAGGHVVITSSVAGLYTNGGAGVYATSKFRADRPGGIAACGRRALWHRRLCRLSGAGEVRIVRKHRGHASQGACGHGISARNSAGRGA
jgi:NADP-dependent 3-hydroxy acid dehydrogenase YdfG